jgi:predicted pyridoxine 5'-phosphate oxidase superfamily flavin-nucleotide-binding protein
MRISEKIKSVIEGKVVVLCTIKDKENPNAIVVEANKFSGDKLLITDNYMNQTLKDIKENENVLVITWDEEKGYKLIGKASYYTEGEYFDIVKPLNKEFPCKGVVVVKVAKII